MSTAFGIFWLILGVFCIRGGWILGGSDDDHVAVMSALGWIGGLLMLTLSYLWLFA